MSLIAWHGKPELQAAALAELEKHRKADALVQGYGYWEDGKGCAVGCLIKSGDHEEYEPRFGIPTMLARLEDAIFEGLPREDAIAWPERFLSAARPGTDLSRVGWQFLHWLLTDETVNPGINHPLVRDAVRQCADVLVPLANGLPVDTSAAWSAESAAWSAASAARSAAESAESAAESAESAAWSAARSAAASAAAGAARSAAESAESAAESAESAAWSAESAARSAVWSAASAARSATWKRMADQLVSLLAGAA